MFSNTTDDRTPRKCVVLREDRSVALLDAAAVRLGRTITADRCKRLTTGTYRGVPSAQDRVAAAARSTVPAQCCYALYYGGAHVVKIGRSQHIWLRWKQLEDYGRSGPLSPIALWEATDRAQRVQLERDLLAQFSEHQIGGEWFDADPVADWAREIATGATEIPTVSARFPVPTEPQDRHIPADRMFLDSYELEQLTGTKASTWRYWAKRGVGPASHLLGRRRVWPREETLAWAASQAAGEQAS